MIEQRDAGEIMSENEQKQEQPKIEMPSLERIQQELGSAQSIDDFFGKEGIFARLFATTLEPMLEAELTAELGYEKYEAQGRHSGNNRNGKSKRKVRSSGGEVEVAVPRDRHGDFEPKLLHKSETSSHALEDKIITLYAKGLSVRDIHDSRQEMYGVAVSASTIRTITEKGLPLVENWQNRRLDAVYPLIYLDGIYVNLKREGRIEHTAVYGVLAVNLEGRKDGLGHWVGEAAEGAKFWTTVWGQLQARGVPAILIACVDGLSGFKDAMHAVFPNARIQRCSLHQIRNSLKYVSYTQQDDFMRDLKTVYQAATREKAETALLGLSQKWSDQYAGAVRSWENNWTDLSAFFDFPYEIRRLIDPNNAIEGYNRQLRKVTKNKTVFPTEEAVRKAFYLAHRAIATQWTMPITHWPKILNPLVIYFTDRIAL
jgi:putative transposase